MTQHPHLFAQLAAPFEKDEVKDRTQAGKTLRYVTARTVMNRLDDVIGPESWWDDFVPLEHSVICRLTIRLPDGQAITKSDAGAYAGMADPGDDDKSGFADAFKRAAVKFGVGRYLYRDGVPRFASNALAWVPDDGPGRDRGPSPEAPRAARPQDQPFDPARLPRAGTGGLHFWLQGLDKHFQERVYDTVREACRAAEPPLGGIFKDWPQATHDDMVNRVIRYCKRLPNYRDEFGPRLEGRAKETPPARQASISDARAACYARACILYTLHYPGKIQDPAELADLIKAMSGEKIDDIFKADDIELVKATTATIEVAIGDAKTPKAAGA